MTDSFLRTLWRMLPSGCSGYIEYHLMPHRADAWGGAFNGQCFRQLMFVDLVAACAFQAVVETGTFRGSTTMFMARNANVPTYSSELVRRHFVYARQRLRRLQNVSLCCQDSRQFLRELKLPRAAPVFFYLDAHWPDDLPLREETEIIIRSFDNFVIMIDDFCVPTDSEYTFDNYGEGKRLCLEDLPFHKDPRVRVYFPSRPAKGESGARRGSVILVSTSLVRQLDSVPTVVPHVDRLVAQFSGAPS